MGKPPKSSILIGFFHYKPSILGFLPLFFGKHPNEYSLEISQRYSTQIFTPLVGFQYHRSRNHRNDSDDSSSL